MDSNNKLAIILILISVIAAVAIAAIPKQANANKNIEFASSNGTTNATISVKATSNGYNVSNVSQINLFTIVMNGSVFKVYVSYILLNSAGIGLNGSVRAIPLDTPTLIRGTPTNLFYVNLTKSVYFAKIPTVNLYFYSEPAPPVPLTNLTYYLTANKPLVVNIPNSSATVTLKSSVSTSLTLDVFNYTDIVKTTPLNTKTIQILNISPSVQTNLAIALTMKYSCGLYTNTLLPYELMANGTWTAISNFTFNENACTITFNIPSDPVVGLFQYQQPASTTSTSAPTTSIIAPTTIQSTTIPQKSGSSSTEILAIIAAIIIIALIYYFAKRPKGKKQQSQQSQPPQK